jgi:hypothetical protein
VIQTVKACDGRRICKNSLPNWIVADRSAPIPVDRLFVAAQMLHLWQKPGFWQKLCIWAYIFRQKPGFLLVD